MRRESRFLLAKLARVAHSGVVDVASAAATLELSPRVVSSRLARWERQGWLARIRRGLYLVLPVEAGPHAAVTVEDPWALAATLYAPCYIGGWSAAEHWELTEQIFRSTFVVTAANVRRRDEQFLGAAFHIVQVAPSRLAGTTPVWRARERIPVSGREKTIADALADPRWVGGIHHLIEIVDAYREEHVADHKVLLEHVAATNSGAAFKRLGFLTEALHLGWEDVIATARARKTAGLVKLDPAVEAKGTINKRWGLRINTSAQLSGGE